MERVDYPTVVQAILQSHLHQDDSNQTEVQFICDIQNHHYQVLHLGWKGLQRVYGCLIHVDIKGEKIWIQRDGTEIGVANQLVEAGVPKQDIVLGFHAPYKRPYTEFAVS